MTDFYKAISMDYVDLLQEELKYDEKTNTHRRLGPDSWPGVRNEVFKSNSIDCIKFFVSQNYDFSDHKSIIACILKGGKNIYNPGKENAYVGLLDYAIREFKIDVNAYCKTDDVLGAPIEVHMLYNVLAMPEFAKVLISHGANVLMPAVKGVAKEVELVDCTEYLKAKILVMQIENSHGSIALENMKQTYELIKERKNTLLEQREIGAAVEEVKKDSIDNKKNQKIKV